MVHAEGTTNRQCLDTSLRQPAEHKQEISENETRSGGTANTPLLGGSLECTEVTTNRVHSWERRHFHKELLRVTKKYVNMLKQDS